MLAKLRASFVVAGLALVAGLAAIIALLFGGPEDSTGSLDSFHFVARLAVEPSEYSAHPTVDRIEGWYRSPELVRWEFSYEDPRLRDRRMVDVQDGDWLWTYDGETNTYSRTPLTAEVKERTPFLPTFSVILGPLPAESVASFFDRWPGTDSRVIGRETLLGKSVQVVQVTTPDGSTLTFWIDPKFRFVLRYVSESEGMSLRAEVTQLEYNIALPKELFRFVPPAGSLETSPGSGRFAGSLGPTGGREVRPPPGFLAPAYLPDGFLNMGESVQATDGRVTAHEVHLGRRGGGAELVIRQQFRAGGLPDHLATGQPISVGGRPGYRSSVSGEETLVFAAGNVVVTVSSAGLPFEELLRVAESLAP